MIEICHLKKMYSNAMPLADVNTTIHKGDVIALIGPSGCGKSTLLRCINMLEPPTSGKIIVCGEEITKKGYNLNKLRLKVGMVFQSYELFNHQSAIENVMRPQMQLLGRSKQEAYNKAYELLSIVGLSNKQFFYPDQLSGGQKQRIAIARALAMDPEILLLDEPTSALDPTMVGEVQAVIQDLANKGTTMMLVTHDMNFAKNVSNRVFYMDEGTVYEDGSPKQIFENPQKEKTRAFIKNLSAFAIKTSLEDFDYPKSIAGIERFGIRQGLDRKTINKLQIIFEELCTIYLFEHEKTEYISILFEHQEEEEMIEITFKHNSEVNLVEDMQLKMSLAIIRRYAESYEQHTLEADEEYKNKITLLVRKGEEHARKK